jgi:hypothetical protein
MKHYAVSFRHHFLAPALSTIVLGASLLATPTVKADTTDTVVFNDVEGVTISATAPAGRLDFGLSDCPNPGDSIPNSEECSLSLAPPSLGATVTSTTLATFTYIAEPNGADLSDALLAEPINPGKSPNWLLDFLSRDTPVVGGCAHLGGCAITENGLVQTIGTITWSDGTIDTVEFQSGVTGVPEPASLVLLGAGFLGLFLLRRRKQIEDTRWTDQAIS